MISPYHAPTGARLIDWECAYEVAKETLENGGTLKDAAIKYGCGKSTMQVIASQTGLTRNPVSKLCYVCKQPDCPGRSAHRLPARRLCPWNYQRAK